MVRVVLLARAPRRPGGALLLNTVVVTFRVPPFDYRSIWWWGLDRLDLPGGNFDLVAPSEVHQFQRQESTNGTAHRLNVYADPDTDWDERERVEFAVKSYVYLSKLHRRTPFERIVVADCAGIEPLITAILSVLAPVHVKMPLTGESPRGQRGSRLLNLAEATFTLEELAGSRFEDDWPPGDEEARRLFRELTEP